MKKLLGFIAAAVLLASAANAQDITGNWQGTLHPDKGKDLRILFQITKDDGKLKAVGYSTDQGPQPMNATGVVLDGRDLKFSVPGVGGTYDGILSADGNTITGTWTQGQPLPLVL